MIMGDEFITYETAIMARDMGFNIKVKTYYKIDTKLKAGYRKGTSRGGANIRNTNPLVISRPSKYVLWQWLMENYDVDIFISSFKSSGSKTYLFQPCLYPIKDEYKTIKENSFDRGLELAFQEALKLVKKYKLINPDND